MRPIKFRAILHLDKVDEKIPAIDIMIDAVAVYPDGSIGFNEQSLKEKLPKNYEIYGDDFGAEIKYADEEGEYFETVFTMLSGEEWFWVEKDFDVMEFTCIKDKNGIEIYEGDRILIERGVGYSSRHYPSFVDGTQHKTITEVKWDNEKHGWNIPQTSDANWETRIEILGNKYEGAKQ